MIVTARMNDVDPQAWLADVLTRASEVPLSRLPELLPWNWNRHRIANVLRHGNHGSPEHYLDVLFIIINAQDSAPVLTRGKSAISPLPPGRFE